MLLLLELLLAVETLDAELGDLLLLLLDEALGVDQLDHEDAVLLVDELLELAVEAVEADDFEDDDSELALERVLLDRLLAVLGVLALDSVLLLALDTLEAVEAVDCVEAELAVLLLAELAVLTLDFVDDGLPRLLTLEAVELIEDALTDCDVLDVLTELALLVEDRDELEWELLLLIDWLEADEPPVVLGVLTLDSLPDDRLEGVRLLEDELLSDCVLEDSDDELTPEDGLLLLLPPVVDSEVVLLELTDVSLSHSVARMYGGNDWAPLKIRELPVLNLRIAGSRFSPPAASVNSNSHWMLSSSVTVRCSVVPASTRVVRRSRPAKPKVPMFDTFQILTVRESKMPVGAGPSQKVTVLAMLAPRIKKAQAVSSGR